MNPEYEAIFYDLPDGTEPVAEFINSQPNKMAAKILWTISLFGRQRTGVTRAIFKAIR